MGNTVVGLRRALVAVGLALLTAAAGFTVAAVPAHAVGTDWYVATDGSDSNDCATAATACKTIGRAVDQAEDDDGGGVIHVGAGTFDEDSLHIDVNVTIEGATDGTTKVTDGDDDVFDVFGCSSDVAPTVRFENLVISGADDGVDAICANVTFVNSHVDGNGFDGIFAVLSVVNATGSTFSGNGTENDADGIFLDCGGAVTADHTTFDANSEYGVWVSNQCDFVAAVHPNAAGGFDTSVQLDHSTVSRNGFAGVGGYDAFIQVLNSTLSGNSGAGLDNEYGESSGNAAAVAEVRNSTITGTQPWPISNNVAAETIPAAGILTGRGDVVTIKAREARAANRHPAPANLSAKAAAKMVKRIAAITPPSDLDPQQVAVSGSIVAEQADGVADCAVSDKFIVDDGYNDSSDAANSCGFSADANDLVSTDPLLDPLDDNGGPTQTQLLQKGSPAIDYIPAGQTGCDADASDQRDLPRVQPVDGACDVGAVELAAQPLTIHPNSLPDGTVGEAYSKQITATGGQYPSYTFTLDSGTLPPGLTLGPNGTVSGTPTQKGSFTFTVSVNDPVLKTYTIVIAAAVPTTQEPTPTQAPTSTVSQSTGPIAVTGANTIPLTWLGILALFAGLAVLLVSSQFGGRRPGRHRR